MLYHDPAAKTHDRVGFTMTMAIALHAAVILGVGFALQIPKASNSSTMEITLSHHSSDKEIVNADFLAQTNQEASGSFSEKKEITTDQVAPINDSEIKQVTPESANTKRQKQEHSFLVISTTSDSRFKANNKKNETEKLKADLEGEIDQIQREIELASLQAQLESERQTFAQLPKQGKTAVATRAYQYAQYEAKWQQRMANIGNQHYPAEARNNKLYGDVTVKVVITPNGNLKSVELLQSSGIKVLDDATLKIIRLASPYDPFTKAMRNEMKEFEIVRTWQFRKDRFQRQRTQQ